MSANDGGAAFPALMEDAYVGMTLLAERERERD